MREVIEIEDIEKALHRDISVEALLEAICSYYASLGYEEENKKFFNKVYEDYKKL